MAYASVWYQFTNYILFQVFGMYSLHVFLCWRDQIQNWSTWTTERCRHAVTAVQTLDEIMCCRWIHLQHVMVTLKLAKRIKPEQDVCLILTLISSCPFSTAACGCCGKSSWTPVDRAANAWGMWWPGVRPSSGPWPGRLRWCRSFHRIHTAGRPSATALSSSGHVPSRRSACRWSYSWFLGQFWYLRSCKRSPWLWSWALGGKKKEQGGNQG